MWVSGVVFDYLAVLPVHANGGSKGLCHGFFCRESGRKGADCKIPLGGDEETLNQARRPLYLLFES
ncbi:hypothetical protein GCM10009861_13840 [Neomicrococcus aestuarii]